MSATAFQQFISRGNAINRGHASKASISRLSTGFTLLVVIVIVGLLAAYVGPKYLSHSGKSEVTLAKAQIKGSSLSVSRNAWSSRVEES